MSILLRFEVQMLLNFQTFKEKVRSTFTEINSKQRKATQSNCISETLKCVLCGSTHQDFM